MTLATAASAHSAKESVRKSRTALIGAVVHTEITNQRVKLTKTNPKKIRSRQHRVSDSSPAISTIQTAPVRIDCQSCAQEKSASRSREYERYDK